MITLMKKEQKPAPKYDPSKIEQKWQKKWNNSKIYRSKEDNKKDKFYVLDMFPYPSGEGLHVGHPKGYIATDIISRFNRMHGKSVLHPMGFDAFGLPAENYAMKTKTNPADAVKKNITRYKKQLEILGLDYDWSREINTTDPAYYKWTQWIFLQMYKKGLAYESNEPINWCPVDKTGLANEDVENGRCERCGALVEKRPIRQWVLKITEYADRLLKDLDVTDYARPKLIDHVNPHRDGAPLVERRVAHAIVYDPRSKKYLIIRNKKHGWDTVIIGGIEGDEDPVETARREVREETGYTDLEFKRVLGGETEAHYYTKHKGQNRVAYAQAVYFELKSDARVPIADGEDKDDEILWIDESDFVPGKMVNSELPLWLERLKDVNVGVPKPMLDWPNSIKEAQRNWIGKSEGAEIDFRLVLKNNKPRFVIIHGYAGSAHQNFIPWLKKELESMGHEVEAPELPNPNNPTEEEQVDYVLKNCKFDENTVVIAHSLGGVVALKAMMKLNKQISGLVLVGTAIAPDFSKEGKSRPFHNHFLWNFDYARINELAQGRIAVLSDTKEVYRAKYLKFLAEKLSAAFIEVDAVEEHFRATVEPSILKSVTPTVKVFTTRPDTIFGVTYVVLAPEHPWAGEFIRHLENKAEVEAYIASAKLETEIERTDAKKEKTGVELKGIKAVNPANGEEVPVWIADYVLADYGTGAVMAVPAHDERDNEFAKKFGLEIREIKLENKDEMTRKFGTKVVKYKLRDWVFSRQRYWGEPIPLIHCEKCGVVPVPEKDLPVKLPRVKSYEPTGTGESPLAGIDKWVNVKCPKCKGKAKRETNTMPQWAGSSWYYLRYMDQKNRKELVARNKEKYWAPVDMYVGGAEHATRHLIYARFWHKFLYDIGVVSTIEPFIKLQHVGLIMGEDGRKMSKRFGNVVNPDDVVKSYGADTVRLYEMFMGPFDQQIAWSTSSMVGTRRFIEKVWRLQDKLKIENSKLKIDEKSVNSIDKILHKTIKKVTDDIGTLSFNTAISTLMIAVNELEKAEFISRKQFEILLKLLAPFAPHATEELWASIGNKKSIHISDWPICDEKLIVDDQVNIIVQINGKVRANFMADAGTTNGELENKAKSLPEIKKWTEGKEIKKVVVIKGKLVSIVVA